MKRVFAILSASIVLGSCAIAQHVEPTEFSQGAELCIVENKEVKEDFLSAIKSVLDSKQIRYVIIDATTSSARCEWSMTYVANWRWDLAMYLAFAKFQVYRDGALDGEALYDSTAGGANMGKFIDAEAKVRELLEQLF